MRYRIKTITEKGVVIYSAWYLDKAKCIIFLNVSLLETPLNTHTLQMEILKKEKFKP